MPGLYYQPGSNKAVLCRRGVGLLEEFCTQRGIRRIECGKVLVALDDTERARLGDIEERALANSVPGSAPSDPRSCASSNRMCAVSPRCTHPRHQSSISQR